MIVVVHHCLLSQPAFANFFFSNWQTAPASWPQAVLFDTPARIVWDGFEAVTFFYVLSGLVLMLPWAGHRPPAYIGYCIKRVCRIYLPYCAAIACAAVPCVLLGDRASMADASIWVREMQWSSPVTAWVLADHALMIGHYNTINGVIHSLIWEMRVSLIFPLVAWPMMRWRNWGGAAALAGLLALIAGLQLAITPPGAWLTAVAATSQTSPLGELALEIQRTAFYACFFVFGAALAINLRAIRALMTRLKLPWRLACLVAGLLVFQGHWTHNHQVQAFMVGIGSCIVICASLSPGSIERVLTTGWLRFLGRISYSVYLVHVPLILASVILLQTAFPEIPLLLFIPPLAVAVGWLFHVAIAEPAAQLGHSIARRTVLTRQRSFTPAIAPAAE